MSGPGFDMAWQQRGPEKLPPLNHGVCVWGEGDGTGGGGGGAFAKNIPTGTFFPPPFLMKRIKWGEDWGANWKLFFFAKV